jgi:hypothetical protein
MLDLGDQKLLPFLRPPAFGNVSSNLDPTFGILDRRYRQRDLDQAPILAPSEGLVVVDARATTDALENFRFLVEAIQWNQNRDRFADGRSATASTPWIGRRSLSVVTIGH